MKYSLSLLAMAAGVFATYPVYSNTTTPVVYETITTTALTTYCPYATTVVHGGKTYTVTEATTLTITDCPCTVTQPVTKPVETPVENPGASTVLYSSCPESATNPSMPDKTITPPVHTYTNPLHPVYPTGTGGGVVPTSPPFTGAASTKQICGFAAAAVAGVVALVL